MNSPTDDTATLTSLGIQQELPALVAGLDAHAIVSVADSAGNILYVNDKFCEVSGYSPEELLGQNHRIVKSDHHDAAFYQSMWGAISAGRTWQGEICNRRKDGRQYWVESTIVPILDAEGLPVRYISIRTDITRVKASEARAREAEANLRGKQHELLEITSRLLESEERLRRSQVFANIGTWDWNIETGALYWSERIAPLFGYEAGKLETSYENFLEAVHPDDRQKVVDAVSACVEGRTEYDIEHRILWPDGEVRWVLERGDVIRSASGNAMRMLGVVQDITERKRMELALRESERRLAEAQRISRLGNWELDVHAGELWWSDEVYQIFGYRKGDFEPSEERFLATIPDEDRPKVAAAEQQARKTGEFDVTHRICRADGRIRQVRERAEFHFDHEGELRRMVGTVQDVTELVELEERLATKKMMLELLRAGLMRTVTDESFRETSGFLLEGLIELTESDFGLLGEVHYEDEEPRLRITAISDVAWDEPSRQYHEQMRRTGAGFDNLDNLLGAVIRARDPIVIDDAAADPRAGGLPPGHPPIKAFCGIPVYHGKRLVAMYALANRPGGYDDDLLEVVAPFDATYGAMVVARRIAEAEKESRRSSELARQEAEKASHAKSEFLSSMSHELRTPLNAILGFSQLLALDEDSLSTEQVDNINEISRAGQHLLELINEVLDLSRIESGRVDLSLEPVGLGDLFAECTKLVMPMAAERAIDVVCEATSQECFVQADYTRLKQVLLNLMSNAVKYNRQGGRVTVRSFPGADGATVRTEVIDTGRGLTDAQIAELFQPFHRLGAEQTEIEGTGIGLSIAKRLLEYMGGEIGVDSAVGEGSCFWFELPTASGRPEGAMPVGGATLPACRPAVGSMHKLLYVEDNSANLRLVRQVVERVPGMELIGAPTPELAMQLALGHRPDLILLDINLPGMSGFELLKRFRAMVELNGVPVIAVSANAMPRDIERGREAGFVDYLTKPLDVERLLEVLNRYLQGGG